MIEVFPSVNEESWDAVRRDLNAVCAETDWIEIDIEDGSFTRRVTWHNPADLKKFHTEKPVKLALHLMEREPERNLEQWIDAGIRRAIFQLDAIHPGPFGRLFDFGRTRTRIHRLAKICKDNWVEFGLSVGPGMRIEELIPYARLMDVAQVLAVAPGVPQQSFDPDMLEKGQRLVRFRDMNGLNFKIEWDGGVTIDTIEFVKKIKADIIISTSFVFRASEPVAALELLRRRVRGMI
jgi:ribulose-phosphate 3-epimerase